MLGIGKLRGGALAVVLLLVVAVAGIGAGFGAGFSAQQSDVDSAETEALIQRARFAQAQTELAARQARIEGLALEQATLASQVKDVRAQVDQLQAQNDGKNSEIASLQREVRTLTTQARTADAEALAKVRDQLAADRLLLVELRKETPQTRAEATVVWENIRGLAARSDTNLVPKAERVSRTIPVYYAWRERDFAGAQEAQIAYILTGASQFQETTDEFWKAFLLVLVNRIDILTSGSGPAPR